MRLFTILLLNAFPLAVFAQADKLTVEQAIEVALKNNASIKAAAFEVESQKQLKKTSFDLPKTNVSLMYGQYNGYPRNDNNISVAQTIPFYSLTSHAFNRSLIASAELKKSMTENELVFHVKQAFHQLAFAKARHQLLLQQDSIYEGFLKAASLRYKTGETNLLEQTTAETQRNEVRNQILQNETSIAVIQTQLQTLLGIETTPDIAVGALVELDLPDPTDSSALTQNPSLAYMRQQVDVAKGRKRVESGKFAPDLQLGFFTQTLIDVVDSETGAIAGSNDRFTGFQVGLAIPLWFPPHRGRVKAAEFNRQAAQGNYVYHQSTLKGEWRQAMRQHTRNRSSLAYFRTSALPNAELMLAQSRTAFRSGDVGYAEYLLAVRTAIGIKEGYLQTLNENNQGVIYLEYLQGNK